MTVRHGVGLTWAALLALGVLAACVLAADPPGPGAKPGDANPSDPLRPTSRADSQFAAAACAGCHSATPDDPTVAKEHSYGERKKLFQSHHYILLSEGKRWERNDPHSQAYTALTGTRGRDMTVAMKQSMPPEKAMKYDVATDERCLTCHAVDLSAGDTSLRPDDETGWKRFETEEGVGCVACHGVRSEWQGKHYEEKEVGGQPVWRAKSAADKTRAGLRHLRDPVVKANLCASCHVGSAELKREVTHEMYAAGHPPLPPFELATFQKGQPPHWAHPTKLPYFDKVSSEDRASKFHFHPKETPAARDVVAGAVAAVRAEAGLLRANAERVLDGKGSKDGIDFARFDCAACHHDLKHDPNGGGSDRQRRGYEGVPGRPPLRASVGLFAGVIAEHAGDTEFASKWPALRKAATDKPFGDPSGVRTAASELEAWAKAFHDNQKVGENPVYTTDATARLREAIGKKATSGLADPEAALVLTWAYLRLGGQDAPAEFEKVLPRAVRPPGARAGDPLGFADRQKRLNAFSTDEFTRAFKGLK